MSTTWPTKEEMQANETWYIVDAEDVVLGRLATRVASVIRGKNEVNFAPHLSPNNHVIVINAAKIKLTGDKLNKKIYYRHTGHVGGIKEITAKKLLEKNPCEVIHKAVKGMLPKNRLGRALHKNLRVFAGAEHTHAAQQPVELNFDAKKINNNG